MKKVTIFFVVSIAMIIGYSFTSDSQSQDSVTSDSTIQAENQYTLTKEGIGPIVLGLPIEKIPASVEGLYDSFTKDRIVDYDLEYDYYILIFYKNGKQNFEATGGDPKLTKHFIIADITLFEGSDVKLPINGKLYGCGDNVLELIQNNILTPPAKDNAFKYQYSYQGINIDLEADIYSKPNLQKPIIKSIRVLNADYFTPMPEMY